jgi:UDP-N-acetylglucosamine transferase subunit ALG13
MGTNEDSLSEGPLFRPLILTARHPDTMIFVVLGTWEMPFTRPLIEIEAAVRQGLLPQPVVVQSGNTSYSSPCLNLVPFFGKDELERHYEQADLVICQAGVGSIMLGLRKQKKVISIARLAKFDEHIDDHQLEILEVFAKSGAVLAWQGAGDLSEVLAMAKTFVSAGYPFGQEKISAEILRYLNENVRAR